MNPPSQRSLPGNIPHIPPPSSETHKPHNPMGSSLSFLKTILIPLLISLALYLTITYALLPLYRRHHTRYSQYLPLHTLSTQTSSVRTRLSRALMSFLLPSSWRRQNGRRGSDSDDGLFDDEEGEGMVGFAVDTGRREELERDAAGVGGGGGGANERRLSRDLEEGFRDDSDDDQGHDQRNLSPGN